MIDFYYRAYAKEPSLYSICEGVNYLFIYLFILIQVDRQSQSAILWIIVARSAERICDSLDQAFMLRDASCLK